MAWIKGDGVRKTITDERLAELMKAVTPLNYDDDNLRKFEIPHLRNVAYAWSPKYFGKPVQSFILSKEVQVDFPCGYYGLFKPSIAEVLAWIPDGDINAFYIQPGSIEIYESGAFQRATVKFGCIDAKDRRGPSPFKKLPEAPPSLKRTDEEMVNFLKDVVGIIDASSNERQNLWEKWHYEKDGQQLSWISNNSGLMEIVGHLNKRPICITLNTAIVEGSKLLFIEATSQLVDHKMIDKWIADNLPDVKRTNATNFHNILP